jgi:UDP-N-acetylmuramate dehydrogenase
VRGLVIINHISAIEFGDWHDGRTVSATAGASLHLLAHKCQAHGLAGMEWAISVPGTAGGAIISNAGAHGADMAASVADVVILTPGGPQMLTNADLNYEYRGSALKHRADRRFVVLLATFCLPHDDPDAIRARMSENIAYRKRTQPGGASLGSIFKNPPGDYAGRLIEAAGLKGAQIGGAVVSPVHANFFINQQTATAADYYALIRHVQSSVLDHSGVQLEPEIEIIGEWAEIGAAADRPAVAE